MQEKSKLVRYGQTALILVILFGFPALSYFYLTKGTEYRRQAFVEMGQHGTMPDLGRLAPVYGALPAELRGQLHVVGWIDQEHEQARSAYGETLERLHQQFNESDRIHFSTIAAPAVDSAAIAYFVSRFKLTDSEQISILRADEPAFAGLGRDFALPLDGGTLPGARALVALVDTSLTIRGYYDLAEEEQARRLVKHIAIILPLPKERDIVFEREKEM